MWFGRRGRWAFFQAWGADALGRVESVLDAMNLQYESEVGITHDLSYFLVRTSATIHMEALPIRRVALAIRDVVEHNQRLIERDVARPFTGKGWMAA